MIHPSGDVTTTGWRSSSGGALYACIDEAAPDTGDWIRSPALDGNQGPAIFDLGASLAAGTYTLPISVDYAGAAAQVRVSLLDGSNAVVGTSAWQDVTSAFSRYAMTVTTTGTASRIKIEVGSSGGTAVVYDTRVGLGADANGIPILIKDSNARYIYCNGSHPNASDSNAGTDYNYPKANPASGWSALRDNYGDWLLIASGTSYSNAFGYASTRRGLSAEYPSVVTTYDATDPTNASKYRTGTATLGTSLTAPIFDISASSNTTAKLVVENLIFSNDAYTDQAISIFTNQSGTVDKAMLWHNCQFRKHGTAVENYSSTATDLISNVTFRHCSFSYAYQSGSRVQGLYMWHTDGVTVEDCVFYHNAWQVSRDEAGGANVYSHNAYFGTMTFNTIFRRNISGHASSHGLQMRGGGICTDNVFSHNPIDVLIGGGDNYNTYRPSGVPYVFSNNVIDRSCDLNSTNGRGFGVWFSNTQDGGTADNNIVSNVGPDSTAGYIYAFRPWDTAEFNQPTYMNFTNWIMWNWNTNYNTNTYTGDQTLSGILAGGAYPSQYHFTYSGCVIHFDTAPTGDNRSSPVSAYPDPTRTVSTYATAHGYSTESDLWAAMVASPTTHWAKPIGDYIRAGFWR